MPLLITGTNIARCGDLAFPRDCRYADYDSSWTPRFCDRTLIRVTACYESSVLFAAREGWVISVAPFCNKPGCRNKVRSSYCSKRSDVNGWSWRFRCCRKRRSILFNSMFYQGKLQPGNILEIIWKMSSRTPVTMIPRLIYGRPASEIYPRVQFLRDVVGW